MGIASKPPPGRTGWQRLLRGARPLAQQGFDVPLTLIGAFAGAIGLSQERAWLALVGLGFGMLGLLAHIADDSEVGRAGSNLRLLFSNTTRGDYRHLGDRQYALDASASLVEALPEGPIAWVWVNDAVCTLISAGCYREALELPDRWTAIDRTLGASQAPDQAALVQINLAEAEYNLGQLSAARERTDRLASRLDDDAGPFGEAVPGIV